MAIASRTLWGTNRSLRTRHGGQYDAGSLPKTTVYVLFQLVWYARYASREACVEPRFVSQKIKASMNTSQELGLSAQDKQTFEKLLHTLVELQQLSKITYYEWLRYLDIREEQGYLECATAQGDVHRWERNEWESSGPNGAGVGWAPRLAKPPQPHLSPTPPLGFSLAEAIGQHDLPKGYIDKINHAWLRVGRGKTTRQSRSKFSVVGIQTFTKTVYIEGWVHESYLDRGSPEC